MARVTIIIKTKGGIILILENSWIEQEGRSSAISKSKIKNRIITI